MSFRFWLITILTLIVVILAGNRFIIPRFQNNPSEQVTVSGQQTVTIGSTTIDIEVADEPAEIQQGLSGRPSLDPDTGMLFVLSQERIPTFWMKDMRFALDFIWIGYGKVPVAPSGLYMMPPKFDSTKPMVLDITENVPPPPLAGIPDLNLLTYSPSVPVTHVLEVNAGFVQSQQISIGDKVILD